VVSVVCLDLQKKNAFASAMKGYDGEPKPIDVLWHKH